MLACRALRMRCGSWSTLGAEATGAGIDADTAADDREACELLLVKEFWMAAWAAATECIVISRRC